MLTARLTSPGLTRFRAALRLAPRELERQLARAHRSAGDAAAAEVRRRVPRGKTTPVGRPHLADTVAVRLVPGGVKVEMTGPHARVVERGRGAWTVRPRRRKVLRFVAGGRVLFRPGARIPARRGRWPLRDGMKAAQGKVNRIYAGALGWVARRLGGQ